MIHRQFGRDERGFRLRVGEWREVEKRCDSGLFEIRARLAPIVALLGADADKGSPEVNGALASGALGSPRIDDIREPILQGLIGGGMTSTEAGALVKLVFDEAIATGKYRALLGFSILSLEIVQQALIGLEDEPIKDLTPGEMTGTVETAKGRHRSPKARPGSPASTPPPP